MNKKLISFALLLTLATTLGACNSDTAPEGGASPGGSPAESSPSPT